MVNVKVIRYHIDHFMPNIILYIKKYKPVAKKNIIERNFI